LTAHALEVRSRFGSLSFVVRDGIVIAAGYHALDALLARAVRAHPELVVDRTRSSSSTVKDIVFAVEAYDLGEVNALQKVPVQQPGAVFMQASWTALRNVVAGTTVSYAQLAALAGRPAAVRAAGTACATNLVAPFIPCHRVIRSDGSLGNYGFGVTLKRALLGHEGALEQGKMSGRE
jgi:methylated-DNA-[protein]-cysteine S-methyltransferase